MVLPSNLELPDYKEKNCTFYYIKVEKTHKDAQPTNNFSCTVSKKPGPKQYLAGLLMGLLALVPSYVIITNKWSGP